MSGAAPRLLACLWLCLAVAPAAAQERKMPPVDEASRDPSWASFRNRLLTALDRRDRKFVLGILDRNIRNSFGSKRGIAEFRAQWDLDAEDSALWRKLSAALFLGGAYVRREKGAAEFCAPYVTSKWPDDVDPDDHGAIIVSDALAKAAPSSSSATLRTLSYDIVTVADWDVADLAADERQHWVKIKLEAGEGYVPEEQIRSPLEHTACFVKTADGWRMTALAAGGV